MNTTAPFPCAAPRCASLANNVRRALPLVLDCVTALASSAAIPTAEALTLWYAKPAAQWEEALPVGSGRLGAMVFGGVTHEHIQFNEGTLWTGQPHEYQRAGAVKALPRMRALGNESRSLWIEARALEKQGKKAEVASQESRAVKVRVQGEVKTMKSDTL